MRSRAFKTGRASGEFLAKGVDAERANVGKRRRLAPTWPVPDRGFSQNNGLSRGKTSLNLAHGTAHDDGIGGDVALHDCADHGNYAAACGRITQVCRELLELLALQKCNIKDSSQNMI